MGIGRLDPEIMDELGIAVGEVIELQGESSTPLKALPAKVDERGEITIAIDGLARSNAEVGLDEKVLVRKWPASTAKKVTLKPLFKTSLDKDDEKYILSTLTNHPVTEEDVVRVELFGSNKQDFLVQELGPDEPAIINKTTKLKILEPEVKRKVGGELTYEYIGGLDREIRRLREMIELPLKFPEVFQKLGVEPPKGVLLHGPPGTGKTLLARALANETDATFFNISGPEIMGKYYGESEARLRNIFSDAEDAAPSIVFIDELDAIASKRTDLSGEKQVEKRVVAQLLSLMDGLESRGEVIVVGATNISDSIDPALRRPGRFDREIEVGIPDRQARKEILQIHTRPMPLSEEISLDELAGATHGFVGADLESLAKEAAMASLRRLFPEVDFEGQDIPYSTLRELEVSKGDFKKALKEAGPSALREIFSEIPEVSWEDIGGLTEIKQNLIEIIQWPFEHGEIFEEAGTRPPKGILLYGEPGTGKTLLAKAVANESGANFISVNASNFISKWVGESENKIAEVFKKARQAAPCVVFFDEIDSLTPERAGAGGNQVMERVVSQLLVELDGTEELHGVVVIGATNRPDIIDPALLRSGRFDVQLELPKPNTDARREILQVHTRDKPVSLEVDLGQIAEDTEGLVGADLESICQKASLIAIRRLIKGGKDLEIQVEDFSQARRTALNLSNETS
ncbi:CDC48 family AAA ATPase [Candidatus Bipolaricaulota bacterium]|nr:CDC48 family AAA ATPase [Candidatus Bipolaricaulota bacterium]